MRDEDPICRDLKIKQETFFQKAEKRGFTLTVLAERTEIPRGTLATYRATGTALMGLATFIKLGRIPEVVDLVAALIADTGLTLTPTNPRAADWLALGERFAGFASKVCRFQATGGFIDHREDAELEEDLITIVSDGRAVVGPAGGRLEDS